MAHSPPRAWRRLRRAAATLVVALLLTVASSAVPRTRLEVQEWDCPPAPASCARPVAVLGFPLPYVSDNHGISVVGRASLGGALVGEDNFHAAAFVGDVVFYALASAGAWLALRAARQHRTDTLSRPRP